jgi:hypothetical protein
MLFEYVFIVHYLLAVRALDSCRLFMNLLYMKAQSVPVTELFTTLLALRPLSLLAVHLAHMLVETLFALEMLLAVRADHFLEVLFRLGWRRLGFNSR